MFLKLKLLSFTRAPLAVSLGAIPGALSRYYLNLLFTHWLGASFPYGTFAINISGALLMGFIASLIASPDWRLLIMTGFLGSYTTFSTTALDTDALLRSGNWWTALFYYASSAISGVVCLQVGSFLARRLR